MPVVPDVARDASLMHESRRTAEPRGFVGAFLRRQLVGRRQVRNWFLLLRLAGARPYCPFLLDRNGKGSVTRWWSGRRQCRGFFRYRQAAGERRWIMAMRHRTVLSGVPLGDFDRDADNVEELQFSAASLPGRPCTRRCADHLPGYGQHVAVEGDVTD